jgi:hypothetical protein
MKIDTSESDNGIEPARNGCARLGAFNFAEACAMQARRIRELEYLQPADDPDWCETSDDSGWTA